MSPQKQILTFVAATYALSWGFGAFFLTGGIENNPLAALFVCAPSFVGIGMGLLFGGSLSDLGVKRFRTASLWSAFFVPWAATTFAFAAVLFSGIDVLTDEPTKKSLTDIAVQFGLLLVAASGEELGWRGFLLRRFQDLGVRSRWIWVGVIWSVWHFPLIFFAHYASSSMPLLSAFIFLLDLSAFAVFLGWLRETSGSIGPVIFAHAVHNLWIIEIYPSLVKPGPLHPYFATESGVFLTVAYAAVAVWILRFRPPSSTESEILSPPAVS